MVTSVLSLIRNSKLPPNWTDLVKIPPKKVPDSDFELVTRWTGEKRIQLMTYEHLVVSNAYNYNIDNMVSDPLPLSVDGLQVMREFIIF